MVWGVAGARILVVEDDDAVRLTTTLVLERQGFHVTAARDGLEALELLSAAVFDCAVVDVMMPRMDGITFLRRVQPLVLPAIMLTARDLPHDQVVGLEAGADDYVVKPFDGEVLAARIRAVLRRRGVERQQKSVEVIGDLQIDVAGMSVMREGVPLTLSGTEFRLLAVFAEHVGQVLSKHQLLEQVWGDQWADDHVVEVNVARLRSKIGSSRLKTVRGLGYKLVAE